MTSPHYSKIWQVGPKKHAFNLLFPVWTISSQWENILFYGRTVANKSRDNDRIRRSPFLKIVIKFYA